MTNAVFLKRKPASTVFSLPIPYKVFFDFISCKNKPSLIIKTSTILRHSINCHGLNRFKLDRLQSIQVFQGEKQRNGVAPIVACKTCQPRLAVWDSKRHTRFKSQRMGKDLESVLIFRSSDDCRRTCFPGGFANASHKPIYI